MRQLIHGILISIVIFLLVGCTFSIALGPDQSTQDIEKTHKGNFQHKQATSHEDANVKSGRITFTEEGLRDYFNGEETLEGDTPITTLVDKIVVTDINDNTEVAIITYDTCQSHCFASLMAVINNNGEPKIIDSVELGDRIPIDKITVNNGLIIVHMRIRQEDEAMADEPSLKTIRKFRLVKEKLVDVTEKTN